MISCGLVSKYKRKENNMIQFLIVCPLMFIAGLVDAIAGGGGLISLPAYIIAGVPAHVSIGTNKFASSMGTVISTGRYLKNGYLKGKILIKIAIIASITAMIGSSLGSNLSLLVSEEILKNLMIVVLPIVAFYVMRNKNIGEGATEDEISPVRVFVVATAAAFFVGIYDGFYGPGAGTFYLLLFTGLGKLEIRNASALTKVINLSSNVSAMVVYMINGRVDYKLGFVAGLFCIVGHYIGSGMVVSNGKKVVRPVILIVLGILFVKIISGI